MGFLTRNKEKSNSFWSTKEGKYGTALLVIMGIAALIGFGKALPFLTEFVMNTGDLLIALGRLALIIGGIVGTYLFLNYPPIKNLLVYGFRGFVSLLVNGYVNRNYVQIMRTYMERVNEKLLVVNAHIKDVARNKGSLEQGIRKYKSLLEEDLNRGAGAERALATETDPEMQMKYKLVLSEVRGRLGTSKDTIKRREEQVRRLETMLTVLNKVAVYSDAMVKKLQFKVDTMVDEHTSISSAKNAFLGAWQIALGGGEEKNFFNQAMETMAKRTGEDIGEIESMLNDFKGLIATNEVDNALYEEEGRKMLDEWQAKLDDKMSDGFSFLDAPVVTTPTAEPVLASSGKPNDALSTTSRENKWLK